jgi:GT2 family glycosyltransferase
LIHETKLGLSNARNRGFAESRGTYLLYLDDDAIPDPDWLKGYAKAFREYAPEGAGGRIVPFADRPVPRWLDISLPEYNHYLVRFDRGNQAKWLNNDVWGANMAFRRDVLLEVGGFDPDLGVKGENRLGGEETDLQQRIKRAGGRILYVPDARVHHLISAEKLRFTFLLEQEFQRGKSQNRLHSRLGLRDAGKELLRSAWCSLKSVSTGKLARGALNVSRVCWYLGHCVDALRTRFPQEENAM